MKTNKKKQIEWNSEVTKKLTIKNNNTRKQIMCMC